MNVGAKVDSTRIVSDEGIVSVKGHRIGKVIKLKARRWVYAFPGGGYSAGSWANREEAVDALVLSFRGGGLMMPCSKRMAKCKASCLHRALVGDYHLARHAQQETADAAGYGHDTEYQEWLEKYPLITFKEYLIGSKRQHAEEVAA